MKRSYSLYEAKARLSSLVRMAREGQHVIITVHGEPAVELRPVEPPAPDLAGRLAQLEERGLITRQPVTSGSLEPVVRRPGALARFLDDRD
ncbi:MAG: type II toxin-antitoxin system prevent-host-death family antitoxin [Gemmatimonadales bacterium]|nr:type II toxin-antitoxin system prevent-host-death family antitoxin [Gemmatimonadales bacterium]